MSDLILGLGFLLVLAGFLLNIPVVAALHFFLVRPLFRKHRGNTKGAVLVSLLLLAGVLSLSYLPGALEFEELCTTQGEPKLGTVAAADGYYVDEYYVWIHSKSEELLKAGTLQYVEGKSNIANNLPYARITLDADGTRTSEQVASLKSEYGLRTQHAKEGWITSTTQEFYRIANGDVISSHTSFDYLGGPLAWLVQPWGRRSCPDYGDEWFDLTYRELPLISFGLDRVEG